MGADAADQRAGVAATRLARQPLLLQWRPYRFVLPRALVTSQGAWSLRRGWLLRLEAADGRVGWGEAALPPPSPQGPERRTTDRGAIAAPPMLAGAAWSPGGEARANSPETGRRRGAPGAVADRHAGARDGDEPCAAAADAELEADPGLLPAAGLRQELEARLASLPAPLACALGMALAELDGLGSDAEGGWLKAPASALLLPAGEAALAVLDQALAGGEQPLSVKWKVASRDDALEWRLLETLLRRLPANGRLRLDANGGWDRATAGRWAERLAAEPRLDWLEQPLPAGDRDGLEALARILPVALDESLRLDPRLMAGGWHGWQVRRPLLEADPRPLLRALQAGRPRLMLSTALETGIGRRFLEHLAGLQALGPTPTAPGLAPGWRPRGALFSPDPRTVWEAAG